jgi:hypothetical protein
MKPLPQILFLDTNIYIIGSGKSPSPEKTILEWAGFGQTKSNKVTVVISDVLVKQILRVARRLQNKDWGGEIIARIWRELSVSYVTYDLKRVNSLLAEERIPREDVEIYVTAEAGQVDCFVSANHKLIHVLVEETGIFEAITPDDFVTKYL